MESGVITFGMFLREKRKRSRISLRQFSELANLSPVHMSNLETGQRPAPKDETLERIAALLNLDKSEEELFYDLAAASADTPRVSGDLPNYIMGNDLVRVALRTAKYVDATDEEWTEFIEKLKKRSKAEVGGIWR